MQGEGEVEPGSGQEPAGTAATEGEDASTQEQPMEQDS